MALKDIVLKLVIDGKESLVTLDKLDSKTFNLQKTLKNTAGALGLAFGSYQVIGFMKDSIELVQRENEVIGKLNATLKSTGYSAGMTSKELVDLANNLEEVNNFKFDDKDIIEAEGLLLTFKKINKEVFPETMQLALDLSVRFEQDLTSSIKMLGKAMEDPVRGLTAMRKAGIQFTEAQEDQIKAYVKANDLMSAQKLILDELSTQVSGSAAASVDEYTLRVNKLGEAWENVMLTTGKALTYFATDVYDFWDVMFRSIGDKLSKLGNFLGLPSNQDWINLFGGKDDRFAPTGAYKFDARGNRIFSKPPTVTPPPPKDLDKDKKKNVYDFAQYMQDLEDEYYRNRLDFEEELNKARQESLDDLPILGDYSKTMAGSGESAGIFQQINFHLSATDVLLSSIRDGFNSAGDAAVGAMSQSIKVFSKANSVLQVFINSLVQATIQALVLKAVASMIGFIFGGPVGMATAVAATPMANGGIVTKPTLSVIGESGPEAVVPLNRYNDMRDRPINITLAGELNVGLNDLRVRLLRVEESINKYK